MLDNIYIEEGDTFNDYIDYDSLKNLKNNDILKVVEINDIFLDDGGIIIDFHVP